MARALRAFSRFLPCLADVPTARLHEAMRYSVLGGGKRLRPILVYSTGAALGAPLERLDPAAAAVELIHVYSLVHDDLPAMDDDDLRRGRPTCHKAYDEGTAVLVGDALQALAFEVLARDRPDGRWMRSIDCSNFGAVHGHRHDRHGRRPGDRPGCGGQAADSCSTGRHAPAKDRRPDPCQRAARRNRRRHPRRFRVRGIGGIWRASLGWPSRSRTMCSTWQAMRRSWARLPAPMRRGANRPIPASMGWKNRDGWRCKHRDAAIAAAATIWRPRRRPGAACPIRGRRAATSGRLCFDA